MLHLSHAIEKIKQNCQSTEEQKCNYDVNCMHDLTLALKDGKLYISKHMFATFSPVIRELFKQNPSLFEINMTDLYSADVKEWLRRWHPMPGYSMEVCIPTENIGNYMLLCERYGMSEMLQFAIKSLHSLNPLNNLDLIKIVNESIASGNTILKHKTVYSVIVKWMLSKCMLSKRMLASEFVGTLSPYFLFMCIHMSNQINRADRIHDRKSLINCPACNFCDTHKVLPVCQCWDCKKPVVQ
jgi:hypothetical protein